MLWLISFAQAKSSCKERKPRITKWKMLAHTGNRTHDPWFSSLVPNPLGNPIWYTNDNLKPIQLNTGVHCAIYIYIVPCERLFSFCHIFRNVYMNMKWMSFCCLTSRYCWNSKMTSISYYYITEYMTNWKQSLTWYDVAIKSTMNTCFLLDKF